MDKILEIVVEYRTIFLIVAIFLVFALIGAIADRVNSKRFTINTEKMRTNITKETVQEENRTAAAAPDVEKTNVASGSAFTDAPVNNQTSASAPSEDTSTNEAPSAPAAETKEPESL